MTERLQEHVFFLVTKGENNYIVQPMAKEKQKQSSPDEMMQQFSKLWQEKWTEMLHEKGWPKEMEPPTLATMPFVNPFMMPHMMAQPQAASVQPDLVKQITALEARLKKLETQLNKKTQKPNKQPTEKLTKKLKRKKKS
jgi:hypothetical protein